MKPLKCQAGQALVETALTLPLLIIVGTVLCASLHRAAVYFFTDYHLHEALLCIEDTSVTECRHELQQRISTLIFTGNKMHVELRRNSFSSEGSVWIDLTPSLEIRKRRTKVM